MSESSLSLVLWAIDVALFFVFVGLVVRAGWRATDRDA
jgi:hypothetical protein